MFVNSLVRCSSDPNKLQSSTMAVCENGVDWSRELENVEDSQSDSDWDAYNAPISVRFFAFLLFTAYYNDNANQKC